MRKYYYLHYLHLPLFVIFLYISQNIPEFSFIHRSRYKRGYSTTRNCIFQLGAIKKVRTHRTWLEKLEKLFFIFLSCKFLNIFYLLNLLIILSSEKWVKRIGRSWKDVHSLRGDYALLNNFLGAPKNYLIYNKRFLYTIKTMKLFLYNLNQKS